MKNKSDKEKLYVVRKYIRAKDIHSALRKEKDTKPHEIYLDEKWQDKHLADAIGFRYEPEVDDE